MRSLSAALAALAVVFAASGSRAAPVETFVEAPGPLGALKGTLLTPEGVAGPPVVLIIPGSGPTDRDGNNVLGVKGATYRRLAEALAARGVATARIDKRGAFASGAAIADPNHVTIADYAADAHAWAVSLKRTTGVRCIWLLGHSEGALVAMAATRNPTDICGVVLVAGPGRRLSDVLRQQLRANPANAPLLDQALAAVDKLEAGQHVDVTGMNPALLPLFRPAVQDFLIDVFTYDPAALVKAYPGPVLVMQGTTDLQVSLEDAARLVGARPGVVFVKLEGVNHVLKAAPADRAANFATYADPSLPLAQGVADPIAAFVKSK